MRIKTYSITEIYRYGLLISLILLLIGLVSVVLINYEKLRSFDLRSVERVDQVSLNMIIKMINEKDPLIFSVIGILILLLLPMTGALLSLAHSIYKKDLGSSIIYLILIVLMIMIMSVA